MNTILISAFPGTGKTHFFNETEMTTLDSDSSTFPKEGFPRNYINHIKANIGKVGIIMISSHKEVRDALVLADLDFTLVYPDTSQKEEYIERYRRRGSPEAFINLISENWNVWLLELRGQMGCDHIMLGSGEYVSDAIYGTIKAVEPTGEAYDSAPDTLAHIGMVQSLISLFTDQMHNRGLSHDDSKLNDPERSIFNEFTPKLKGCTYDPAPGSEYQGFLRDMGTALKHHYEKNSHHPEHHPEGVFGMDLFDIVEMFCDWAAATTRHADGDMQRSIVMNEERFDMDPQLRAIFENTLVRFHELDWDGPQEDR